MSFFNQFLVPDQQEDELLDPLAAEYARRSSSRGATSIQPRSPVAATSATSSTGANPVPGPTVLAPQLSLGWPANNPQISPAQLGQSLPAALAGFGLAGAAMKSQPAALVQQPQPQSIQRKPPVRSAVPHPAARAQSNVPPLHPNSSTTQSATPAPNTSVVPHSTWRYIAEHPELPEYAPLYQKALNQISPQEKLEIRNKRIAAYPENQSFTPSQAIHILAAHYAGLIPEENLPPALLRFKRDVLGDNPNKNWMNLPGIRQTLEADLKYVGDPYEEGKQIMADAVSPVISGTLKAALGYGSKSRPNAITRSIDAGGKFLGHMATDPMNYLYAAAIPGRTVGRGVNVLFGAQMAKGTYDAAGRLGSILDRSDIPVQQKYDLAADAVFSSIMTAMTGGHMIRDGKLPIDQRMLAEIERLGAEAKQQIFSRVERELRQQEALKKQTAPTPVPRTQIQKPAAPVRKTTTPSGQTASVLSRPDISPGQKHDLIADSILGGLTHETAGRNATPEKTPQHSDDPVEVMRRSMERNGELPPTPKEASPMPQLALDPEKIAEIGPQLAPLSHADQQGVLVRLHDKLSQAIAAQKKILGPGGQLHIVNSPAEAGKLAQQFINDSISKHDERTTTPEQPESQPASSSSPPENPHIQQNTQPLHQKEIASDSLPSRNSATPSKINRPDLEPARQSSPEEAARIDPRFRLDSTNANLMHYEVIRRQGIIPPYIRLNHIAYQIIAGIRGRSFHGVNVPLEQAQWIIREIRQKAATEPSRLIQKKLYGLARKLNQISTNDDGLSMVRKTGSPEADFRAIQEELFHSAGQRRFGKGSIAAGTPHEALAGRPELQKVRPRIREENHSDNPVTLVSETIHDIWSNEAPELTAEEQSAFAEAYWEELANKVGAEALHDFPQLWDYFQRLARDEYNLTTKEVMNDRAYQTLQRVIARRTRPENQTVQRTDQPTSSRIPLQHRGRQETQGDSGKSEKPEGEPGSGPEEVERPNQNSRFHPPQDVFGIKGIGDERTNRALAEAVAGRTRTQGEAVQGTDQPVDQGILLQHRQSRETRRNSGEGQELETKPGIRPGEIEQPPSTGQSVFLPDGRKATIQYISPAMKVARVRTADGQTRTIKLSALPPAQTRPIADMRNVPEMGHNMTANAPSVRRAKAEAAPVRGQTPTIKVKQEPAEIQVALTQPPAPVRAADAARVGQRDPQSGRTILQPSNDLVQNERLANQAAPELNTRLSRVAAKVDGAKFDRLRPQKGLQRLQEKVADGKPAITIGDNLAAQIVVPTVSAKNRIIAELHREFPVISVDDKFLEPREKAGYPSANVQVQMPNGSTAEVQIVAPEVQKITDRTHHFYTLGRNYPEGSPERAYYWNQAAAIHMQALESFKARTAQQAPADLALGQRVVLRDRKTGEIVGFSTKFDRVSVKTHDETRTVKPGEVTPLITRMDRAVPATSTPANEAYSIAAARRGGHQPNDELARQLSQQMLNEAEYYQNLRDNMQQKYNIDLSSAEQANSMEGDEYRHVPASVKEEWKSRWKKIRTATPPRIALDQVERKLRVQEAVRRGKSEFLPDKHGIPTIKLNDEMMRLCAALGADVESLAGGNLSPNQARILISELREQADIVRMITAESPAALEALADYIEQNLHPHGGITLLRGPKPKLRIMREEWVHFVQRLLGKGKFSAHVDSGLLAEHPVARKARPRFVAAQYGWLTNDALVFELSAKLMADAGNELGLSGKEQDSFLDAYFKEILKQHGTAGLQKFWNIAGERARTSIQRVRSPR